MKTQDYVLILVPQMLSFLFMYLYPSNFKDNKTVFFQPPGYVFGIVWSLIYLLLGVYLYLLINQRKSNPYFKFMLIIYILNLILNLSWTPVVNVHKKYKIGIFMIALMILTGLTLISIDDKRLNRTLLIPYVSWLFVALLLNVELARINK